MTPGARTIIATTSASTTTRSALCSRSESVGPAETPIATSTAPGTRSGDMSRVSMGSTTVRIAAAVTARP